MLPLEIPGAAVVDVDGASVGDIVDLMIDVGTIVYAVPAVGSVLGLGGGR